MDRWAGSAQGSDGGDPPIGRPGRQIGRILQMAFGWATVMLFGRVPQSKQLLLAVVALGSIAWVVASSGSPSPTSAIGDVIG